MRHGRPRRDDAYRKGRENVPRLSAPRGHPRQGRPEGNGGNQCQPGGRPGSGLRVEVAGTMYLKRRGEKLYFNLFANEIRTVAAEEEDAVRGELLFRGKVGQHIEEKRDKNDQPYTIFSAFSAEKVDEGFEYQWVRFLRFGQEREAWLQPGVRVEAKGALSLTAYNGKTDISCRTEELAPCPADASHSNP